MNEKDQKQVAEWFASHPEALDRLLESLQEEPESWEEEPESE